VASKTELPFPLALKQSGRTQAGNKTDEACYQFIQAG
jgi:hypothetical protein